MKKPIIIFSKRIERGTILWLLICVGAIFLPRIEAYFFDQEVTYEWTYEQDKLALQSQTYSVSTQKNRKQRFHGLWKRTAPEALGAADWQRLGLSPKQAASLLRYRDKYGFHSLEQMQRIRVLPSPLLALIADSLLFNHDTRQLQKVDSKAQTEGHEAFNPPLKKIQKLELNTASEAALVALPGVGAYTAQKIIAYRERLGGFLNLEQLSEVKGLKPEVLQVALNYLEVKQEVKPIPLNEVSYEQLKQHPYLNWNQANSIIKMRTQKGKFKSVQELKESVLIDEETYKKLLPYVSL